MRLRRESRPIPPLKRSDGSWATSALDKASLLASTWEQKSRPHLSVPSDFDSTPLGPKLSEFFPVRLRSVMLVLRQLQCDKATGPDRVSNRLLKECFRELSLPLTILIRRMLRDGEWPACWRLHMLHPLHKKKARNLPDNYRGLHLTSNLSKVAERILSPPLVQFLSTSGGMGAFQFAYRPGHSCRDIHAILVNNWLLLLARGRKVALFQGDVSGAFDRVPAVRLLRKLRRAGLSDCLLALIKSFLQPRRGYVAVAGSASKLFVLSDSVFQGAVLGPPLWNAFAADVEIPICNTGAFLVDYADDLNTWMSFPASTPNDMVFDELRPCSKRDSPMGRG